MSNIWDDEPFHDGAPVLQNGEWMDPQTYSPVPDTQINHPLASVMQVQRVQEDEELPELVLQEDDDDEDYAGVLSDARLRLEQGKLYEMIMNHNLFDDVDADPRAAKSVQKQIRKWAKNQMEIMLGMAPDPPMHPEGFTSSPFNGLEVIVLKKLASVYSKGETESEAAESVPQPEPVAPTPKKKTLNSIGSSKPKNAQTPGPGKPARAKVEQAKPIQNKVEPIKREAKLKQEVSKEGVLTGKMLHEMTEQEKQQKIQDNIERNKGKIIVPADRIPQPDYATREMLAYSQVSKVMNPGKNNLSAAIMSALKNTGKI